MKLFHTLAMLVLIVLVLSFYLTTRIRAKKREGSAVETESQEIAKHQLRNFLALVVSVACIAVPIFMMPSTPYDVATFGNPRTDITGYDLQYNRDGSLKYHKDGSLDIDYHTTTTTSTTYAKNWAEMFSLKSRFIVYVAIPLAAAGVAVAVFLSSILSIGQAAAAGGRRAAGKTGKFAASAALAVTACSILIAYQAVPALAGSIEYNEMRRELGLQGISYADAIKTGDHAAAAALGDIKARTALDPEEGNAMKALAGILSNGTMKSDRLQLSYYVSTDNGTVKKLNGGEIAGDGWSDIVAFDFSDDGLIAGVRSDGTVVLSGQDANGKTLDSVSEWQDIIDVKVLPFNYIYGLKADGTVVLDAETSALFRLTKRTDPTGWSDIVRLWKIDEYGGSGTILGIDSLGRLFVSGDREKSFPAWQDIETVYYEDGYYFGKQRDGNWIVYDTGHDIKSPDSEEENVPVVEAWQDMDSFAVHDLGNNRRVVFGLKSDGTVAAVGSESASSAVSGWRDIIAVYTNDHQHVFGLKRDGTIVSSFFTL